MGWCSYNDDVDDRRDADAHHRPPEPVSTVVRSTPPRSNRAKRGRQKADAAVQNRRSRAAIPAKGQQEKHKGKQDDIAKLRAENTRLRADLRLLEDSRRMNQACIRDLIAQVQRLKERIRTTTGRPDVPRVPQQRIRSVQPSGRDSAARSPRSAAGRPANAV